MYLALNNLQTLICHKTQTTNQPDYPYVIYQLIFCYGYPIYPTTPHGQDMTQGQFLSGV